MIKRLIAGISMAALAGAAVIPASADAAQPATLAAVLLADKAGDNAQGFDNNWSDYDIVTQAVLLFPDLTAAASDPAAKLTAFLPNDAAFRELAYKITKKTATSEGAAFAAVASLGTDTVKNVLLYHLVGRKIPAAHVIESLGKPITTLLGATITPFKGVDGRLRIKDADTNSRNAVITLPNLAIAGNGVAHGVDRVIRPINL